MCLRRVTGIGLTLIIMDLSRSGWHRVLIFIST